MYMDELKNIAPKLSGIPKKNNFDVPSGYFDSLPEKIQNKIEANTNKGFSYNGLLRFLKPQIVLVAGMSLFAIATYFIIKMSVSEDPKKTEIVAVTTIPEQTEDELTTYCLNNMDEKMLIDAFIEEENRNESIPEDELLEYIADNIDTYTIIENY